MNNYEKVYSSEGKRTVGFHTPITCPFCGPDPLEYIPPEKQLKVEIQTNVDINAEVPKTLEADIVFCANCGKVLSVIPHLEVFGQDE